MEWYMVYRYYCNDSGAALWEIIDGVYCTHEEQAVRVSRARVSIGRGDALRAWRCETPSEIAAARRAERRVRIPIKDCFDFEPWTRTEFVDFMCLPAYEGSRK